MSGSESGGSVMERVRAAGHTAVNSVRVAAASAFGLGTAAISPARRGAVAVPSARRARAADGSSPGRARKAARHGAAGARKPPLTFENSMRAAVGAPGAATGQLLSAADVFMAQMGAANTNAVTPATNTTEGRRPAARTPATAGRAEASPSTVVPSTFPQERDTDERIEARAVEVDARRGAGSPTRSYADIVRLLAGQGGNNNNPAADPVEEAPGAAPVQVGGANIAPEVANQLAAQAGNDNINLNAFASPNGFEAAGGGDGAAALPSHRSGASASGSASSALVPVSGSPPRRAVPGAIDRPWKAYGGLDNENLEIVRKYVCMGRRLDENSAIGKVFSHIVTTCDTNQEFCAVLLGILFDVTMGGAHAHSVGPVAAKLDPNVPEYHNNVLLNRTDVGNATSAYIQVTGAPGIGKTTVPEHVLKMLWGSSKQFCAVTIKCGAAQRLSKMHPRGPVETPLGPWYTSYMDNLLPYLQHLAGARSVEELYEDKDMLAHAMELLGRQRYTQLMEIVPGLDPRTCRGSEDLVLFLSRMLHVTVLDEMHELQPSTLGGFFHSIAEASTIMTPAGEVPMLCGPLHVFIGITNHPPQFNERVQDKQNPKLNPKCFG